MATVYGGTNDGWIQGLLFASWDNLRADSGASKITNNSNTRDNDMVLTRKVPKGPGLFIIRRAFFEFDTSSISVAPSSADLKIYGFKNATADVIAVASEHSATLATGDFDVHSGATSQFNASDGSGAGTLAGVSGLTYSSELTPWNNGGYNTLSLNATALADIASLSLFKVCVLEYDHDYLDIEPTGLNASGCFWADTTGEIITPYIDYTAGGVVAAEDNAILFGTLF